MVKMCLNWKVLVGLAAVGAGVYAFAPDMFAAAAPLLLLAICPLSMIAMMVTMKGGAGQQASRDRAPEPTMRADNEDLEERLRQVRAQERTVPQQLSARSHDRPADVS